MRGTVRPASTVVALTVAVGLAAGPSLPALASSSGSSGSGKATVVGATWGDPNADLAALDLTGRNDPAKDAGSLFTITSAIGAREVWKAHDATGRAVTGRGVTVALLDSGLAPVPGLDAPGKVVQGPDLSLEANSGLVALDTFGHGTHLGGIIAAKDLGPVDLKTGEPKASDPRRQLGVAPDARLLAVKLATTDGSTDVSQVIAALDWVTQHRNDNGLNVRVVNLSFGTASVQAYQIDPLAAAAENAWRHGLVVVVSGGNEGPTAGGLTDPAIDPFVIAVGSSDPQGSPSGWTKNPTVAAYSSRGTATRHVDLLAPGRSVVSLRDPGSFIDVNNPGGRVGGDLTGRLFRGSGTSQAAAVTSGAVALLLQAFPKLTPDQVKATLMATATPMPGVPAIDGGAGQLNISAALTSLRTPSGSKRKAPVASKPAVQTFTAASGAGSLEAARGGYHLVDATTGVQLAGEVDVQGMPWDGRRWFPTAQTVASWHGGTWNGAVWTGSSWTPLGWQNARWGGSSWSSARWSDVSWDSARWSSARWSSAQWDSARWSGNAWS